MAGDVLTAPTRSARSSGDLTFAVAFGGGGARGLAHIHVIEVLDELGIRPVAIAGSSIGAIMGAGMAAGMAGRDIHGYARSVLGDRAALASLMWRMRPTNLRQAFGGIRVSQFDIERILRSLLPKTIPDDFAGLQIPLQVTATDFFGHSLVVTDEGDLFSALAASAAIPALFRPVRRDGRLLIDGGIYDPVPYDLLMDKADIVIGIDVVGAPEGDDRMPNSIDLMFGASQLMMQSIIKNKLTRLRPAIFLRPPLSRFRVLDFLKIDAVLRESEPIRDELKREIDKAVETHVRTESQ
ncbi:MAG: patatin-like phospholipase family protein [Rhizobiaceae bacterium]